MRSTDEIFGEMGDGSSEPEWGPLESLLGSDALCAHFMWMFDVELEDGTILHAYKHRWTRCYFHLSLDGRAFLFTGEHHYREVDPYRAIKAVFAQWECCKPTDEERAALRAASRKALLQRG
jgi:hypothetical protein